MRRASTDVGPHYSASHTRRGRLSHDDARAVTSPSRMRPAGHGGSLPVLLLLRAHALLLRRAKSSSSWPSWLASEAFLRSTRSMVPRHGGLPIQLQHAQARICGSSPWCRRGRRFGTRRAPWHAHRRRRASGSGRYRSACPSFTVERFSKRQRDDTTTRRRMALPSDSARGCAAAVTREPRPATAPQPLRGPQGSPVQWNGNRQQVR